MIARTLTIAAIAASLAATSTLASAARSPQQFNNCVKAFIADLSKKGTATLKLVDSRYLGDDSLEFDELPSLSGTRELALVVRDAHDHHAIARASCVVNAQGDVIELR